MLKALSVDFKNSVLAVRTLFNFFVIYSLGDIILVNILVTQVPPGNGSNNGFLC